MNTKEEYEIPEIQLLNFGGIDAIGDSGDETPGDDFENFELPL